MEICETPSPPPRAGPGARDPFLPGLPLLRGLGDPLRRGFPTLQGAPGREPFPQLGEPPLQQAAAAFPRGPQLRPRRPGHGKPHLPRSLPQPSASSDPSGGGGGGGGRAEARGEVLPGQRAGKMAAPMELFCWSGGWGLPSVDLDSLAVLVRGGAGALED